ncbi:DUF2637 domain-containing protein [Streptomyces sp. NPDC057702]|uniref:DUF2637 domain-containing protein n=1 Tax=unclassified Streptomyces TaxID=2593676 RepID=UPI0036BCE99B
MRLTRTHRILIGVIIAGAAVIAAIGFVGSYAAVRDLAREKGFGSFANVFPIGIDAGIVVLLALDLLLTWIRIPFPLLRQTAWLLTAATIAFNGAAAWPDPLGVGMHAVIPVLFVVAVEAARHAIGRIADITADRHMESVRVARWLLAPVPTFRLWRRMKLWELRSYNEVIRLEQDRLVYRARLRARFGRAWRRKAPVESLMPLRLARYGVPISQTAPAGLAAAGIVIPPELALATGEAMAGTPQTAALVAAGATDRAEATSPGPAAGTAALPPAATVSIAKDTPHAATAANAAHPGDTSATPPAPDTTKTPASAAEATDPSGATDPALANAVAAGGPAKDTATAHSAQAPAPAPAEASAPARATATAQAGAAQAGAARAGGTAGAVGTAEATDVTGARPVNGTATQAPAAHPGPAAYATPQAPASPATAGANGSLAAAARTSAEHAPAAGQPSASIPAPRAAEADARSGAPAQAATDSSQAGLHSEAGTTPEAGPEAEGTHVTVPVISGGRRRALGSAQAGGPGQYPDERPYPGDPGEIAPTHRDERYGQRHDQHQDQQPAAYRDERRPYAAQREADERRPDGGDDRYTAAAREAQAERRAAPTPTPEYPPDATQEIALSALPDDIPRDEAFYGAFRQFVAERGAFPDSRQFSRYLLDLYGIAGVGGGPLPAHGLRREIRELRERYRMEMETQNIP